jgi:SAM-dependent methyltransferase
MIEVAGITIGAPDEPAILRLHPRPPRAVSGVLRARNLYGHGTTPETRAFLDIIAAEPSLAGKHVADVGSGTGVLAIHAALRGAVVTVFEDDPVAREATIRNAAMNGVVLTVRGLFPDEWDGTRFDLAFANLGREVPPLRLADRIYVTMEEGGGAELLVPQALRTRRLVGSVDSPEDGPVVRSVAVGGALVPRALAPRPPEDGNPTVSSMDEALRFLRGHPHPDVSRAEWADWEQITLRIARKAREVVRQHPCERDALAYLVQRGNEGKIDNRYRLTPLEEAVRVPWHMITINKASFGCGCVHDQAYRDFTHLADVHHVRALDLCEHHWGLSARDGWGLIHEHGDIESEIGRLHPDEVMFAPEQHLLLIKPAASLRAVVDAEARLMFGGQRYTVA